MKKNETLIEKACANFPDFILQYKKLKRWVKLASKSQSTLTNYIRCLAHMGLHFKADLPELNKATFSDFL
jgi:integrase/recombinase XerD